MLSSGHSADSKAGSGKVSSIPDNQGIQNDAVAKLTGRRRLGAPPIIPQNLTMKRRLMVLSAVLVVTFAGLAGLLAATQYADSLSDTQRNAESLAQVLAEQTSRTLQPVDLTLREVQARLAATQFEGSTSTSAQGAKAIYDLLAERIKSLPQVDTIFVLDRVGHLASLSRTFPPPPLDASNREFFQYFRANDDHALFISAPTTSYLSGRWSVFLTRRINDAHGEFAGVVVAGVPLSYLEDFYRVVAPQHEEVSLLRRDGMLLVHYPAAERQIGNKLPSNAPWYKAVQHGGGSYNSPGYLDGIVSLVSVRPLREFPLVIDVSTARTAALYGWHRKMLWVVVGTVLASGIGILLLQVFGMQYSRLVGQNAQLEASRQHFNAVLDNISQGLAFFDGDARLLVCNRRFTEIYRLPPDRIGPGTALSDIIACRIAAGSFPNMTVAEFHDRRDKQAKASPVFDHIDELRDGRAILTHRRMLPGGGWVVTHEDITERRQAEATMAFMACHDALTELPNRMLFQERLAVAIAGTRHGGHCALLCLDLDRFKVVNDTLGHLVGDVLLRAVAARLSSTVRDGDTVARLGGDEFAIILVNLKSPDQAAASAERLIEAFLEPYEIEGHRITLSTSIGISISPKDGTSPDTLLQNADIALYLAKAEGRASYRYFESELDSHIQRRRVVEMTLRNAVPAEDFRLDYQPILDLATGRVTGFEALIRWHHPQRGIVSPAEFIPIAEETGLIVPIGAWALRHACLEAVGWPADVEIAVNLSPIQFKRGQLLDVVQEALDASGLAPGRLELEITESTLLESSGERLAVLHQLRALGIRIALDDFGTGYSSLSYLRSFPFNKIKIDRSFIRDINTNKESAAIVGAIVGLARSLGMTTVAEGVETSQQLMTVRDQGVAKVQGYLFSKPRPAQDVMALIPALQVPDAVDETGAANPYSIEPSTIGAANGQTGRFEDDVGVETVLSA